MNERLNEMEAETERDIHEFMCRGLKWKVRYRWSRYQVEVEEGGRRQALAEDWLGGLRLPRREPVTLLCTRLTTNTFYIPHCLIR